MQVSIISTSATLTLTLARRWWVCVATYMYLPLFHTVKTEILLWPKVWCFSSMLDTNCYCELVTNVVYNNFQDILSPYTVLLGIQEIPSISTHFNCSFVQMKQQTSGHNNIPLLGVHNPFSLPLLPLLFPSHGYSLLPVPVSHPPARRPWTQTFASTPRSTGTLVLPAPQGEVKYTYSNHTTLCYIHCKSFYMTGGVYCV